MEDRLEAVLSGEKPIAPPAHFQASVMAAVRREREEIRAIPFPWVRLTLGLGMSLAAAVLGASLVPPGSETASHLLSWTASLGDLASLATSPGAWGVLAAVGSALLVRFSLGFTAR